MRSTAEAVGGAEAEGARRYFEEAVGRVSEWKGQAVKPNDVKAFCRLTSPKTYLTNHGSAQAGLFGPSTWYMVQQQQAAGMTVVFVLAWHSQPNRRSAPATQATTVRSQATSHFENNVT